MGDLFGDDYNEGFETFAAIGAAVTIGSTLIGGIGKGIAKLNERKAEEIYDKANGRYMASLHIFRESTEKTKTTIKNVVSLKKEIMCNDMKRFLKAFKRIKPEMQLLDSQGLSEMRRFNFGQENFNEIKESINSYRSYNEHRLGERAADVALCMVQDGTVSKLADSVRNVMYAEKINDSELKTNNMDELKIQSISAIAQFSVIAVEFGFSGVSDAFSAGRELNRVKERAAQLECQKEEIDIKITKINVIDDYANIHLKALNKLAPYMKDYITQAVQIIKSKDNIFHLGKISVNKFTENEIDILSFTCALSQAMKAIIDSPIISKSGDVFGENKEEFQRNVDEVERKCIEMSV